MWYELDEGNKRIKRQCDTLLNQYTITEIIEDKELINIDDMWEMIEQLCYKVEGLTDYINSLPDYE